MSKTTLNLKIEELQESVGDQHSVAIGLCPCPCGYTSPSTTTYSGTGGVPCVVARGIISLAINAATTASTSTSADGGMDIGGLGDVGDGSTDGEGGMGIGGLGDVGDGSGGGGGK